MFKLFALDIELIIPTTNVNNLMGAIDGHTIDQVVLIGRFSKNGPPSTTETTTEPTLESSTTETSANLSTTSNPNQTSPGFEIITFFFGFVFYLLRRKYKKQLVNPRYCRCYKQPPHLKINVKIILRFSNELGIVTLTYGQR